jgi:hypothetical protein
LTHDLIGLTLFTFCLLVLPPTGITPWFLGASAAMMAAFVVKDLLRLGRDGPNGS